MLKKILNLFNNDEALLLKQTDFESKYQLIVESEFKMGAENEPFKLKNTTDLELKQSVLSSSIITAITIINSKNETDNRLLEEGLSEAMLFAEIIPILEIKRSMKGVYSRIQNMDSIKLNWENWKEKKLPTLFPSEVKQKKIISNFERGLNQLEYELGSNLQYNLLLPECYKYVNYPTIQDVGVAKSYKSRLIENIDLRYRMQKTNFKSEKEKIHIHQKSSTISDNQREISDFYRQNLADYNPSEYCFNVKQNYIFEHESSKIIEANMVLIESLHPNYKYNLNFTLKELPNNI